MSILVNAQEHREAVSKSAAGAAGRSLKRTKAVTPKSKPLVAHPDDEKRGINRYRNNDINREGMTSLPLDEVGKAVSKSAFGVELDEVEKGLGYGKLGRKASGAAKDTIKLEFKKPKPGVTPTGPGSQRGSMSASAWESRTAAARRSS